MASVAALFRKVEMPLVRGYFASNNIALDSVDWDSATTTPALRALEELNSDVRGRVINDFTRMVALADEAGQTALYAATRKRADLDKLRNGHARAFWVFVHDPEGFRRAEEIRYTDDHRRGKQWDGFAGEPGLDLRRDDESVEAFKEAVRQHFGSKKVHVDLFDRQRKRHAKGEVELVQATVYLEGRPDQVLEFVGENLDLRDHRPVIEASLTYEPSSGSIEVVAADRQTREDFVRVFAEALLSIEIKGERLPFRYYDLDNLTRPFAFRTESTDGIANVRVNSLRLVPLGSPGQRLTLECMREETGTIWEMSHSKFGASDPLRGGWRTTQAKFTIEFRARPGEGRGKKLPVTITMPHGCDLKDRTERERLVGEKYLRQWKLLRDL